MHEILKAIKDYFLLLLFLGGLFLIGNSLEREQFVGLIIFFTVAFHSYWALIGVGFPYKKLLAIGIIARLFFFFSLPALSDDIYRFIWDGLLLKSGFNPYAKIPSELISSGNINGITTELLNLLNSPDYFTVYPPINQAIFWLSTTIGGDNYLISTNVIRVILLLADIGSCYFLRKILPEKKKKLVFLYFLNPLVIIEFVGNTHFEGVVIFFLLMGTYYLQKNKKVLSGLGFGLAIGTKLLPAIFLPILFLKGLKNNKWQISIIAFFIAVLTIYPMLNTSSLDGMQNSLSLYFKKFEFNASLYFIARKIGEWYYGYNNIEKIGPLLSAFSLISILIISILGMVKKWQLERTLLLVLTSYLLFSTTVHPWYVIPLIPLAILSKFDYPITWSNLVFLTYFGYSSTGFDLPIWVILAEYSLVIGWMVYELKTRKNEVT